MVCPLVSYIKRSRHFIYSQVSNTIFCKNSYTITNNHFWYTVIDFWGNVIRTTSNNNTSHIIIFNIFKSFLALSSHICSKVLLFFISKSCSSFNFLFINVRKFFLQSSYKYIFFIKGKERISKINI